MIEVVKGCQSILSEIRIGGFEFFPTPEVFIQNCAFCNKELYEVIAYFNATKDLKILLSLQCGCKKRWENEILGEQYMDSNLVLRVYKMLGLG